MCGLIIKLFVVPPLAGIRQEDRKKPLQWERAAAFRSTSLVYLTLSGVTDVCSGDRNVAKHAIISKNAVPYVAAEASQEKYGYLGGGNVHLFCFYGGKGCSKSHMHDRKDDSQRQRCVQACVLQLWERIVSGGLSYGAGDASRSGGGREDDTAPV